MWLKISSFHFNHKMKTPRLFPVLYVCTGVVLLIVNIGYFFRFRTQPKPIIKRSYTNNNNLKVHGMDYNEIVRKFPLLKQGNETKQRFPSAIIIGVRKGGTATLRNFLAHHPLIEIVQGEGHFFSSTDYEKGFEYYRSLMPLSKPGQITIEKTPSYIRKTLVPERIRFFNPKIKLIVLLRDPVSRLISDYAHNSVHLNRIEARQSFEEVFFFQSGDIITEHRVTMRGIYVDQLRKWFENFHQSQFLILDTEELIKTPYQALHKAEQFLDLPEFYTEQNFFFHESKGFFCYQDNRGPACLPDTKGRPHPNISKTAIDKLTDFYKPYNRQLVEFLGRNFSWTV